LYQKNGGPHFPPEVKQQLTLATQTWSPDYRYEPGSLKLGDAEDFMAATAAIIEWAKGRL
jgi:hypothetical protein